MTTTEALQACREIDPGRDYHIYAHHELNKSHGAPHDRFTLVIMPGFHGAKSTSFRANDIPSIFREYRRRSTTTP